MAGAHENDGNSPDDLPDLPEEWGVIVIPDDLSELSDEVEAVRAELRQTDRSDRWRRLFDRPGLRQLRGLGLALLRAPVLIISMAVLVTVASLFASAWPGPPRQPVVQRTDDDHTDTLPAIDLVGADGRTVPLRAKLPAVILVTDGCDCQALISATAAAAKDRPQIVIVVIAAALSSTAGAGTGASASAGAVTSTGAGATAGAVTSTGAGTSAGATSGAGANAGAGTTVGATSGARASASTGAGTGAAKPGPGTPTAGGTRATPATQTTPQNQTVLVLHQPAGADVRRQLKLGQPDGTAGALLVDSKGQIVKQFNRTASVDELEPYLARI